MSTYNERNQLAAEHFTSTRPGTEVTDGKVYFEGKQIGYFGIHHE